MLTVISNAVHHQKDHIAFIPYREHAWNSLSAKLRSVVNVKSLSRVRLFVTPWSVAYQAPLPMRFSRQEYWSGLPFLFPGMYIFSHIQKLYSLNIFFRNYWANLFAKVRFSSLSF